MIIVSACKTNKSVVETVPASKIEKPDEIQNGGTLTEAMNPLLVEFDTPFGVPPFDQIAYEHYIPAIKKGMEVQNKEIDAIISNPSPATFKNTIAALDYSGKLLGQVSSIFYNVRSANTSPEMQEIATDLVPLMAAHRSNISLNADLFAKIKAVYKQKDDLDLTEEQAMLLDKTYKNFIRGGANLNEEDKANLRKIDEELSMLSLRFGDNLMKETNAYSLVIEDEKDLAGLPANVISTAAETASAMGKEGKWVFTLHKPSWIPFLSYAENRELREEIYKAMYNRANNGNERDNKLIIENMIKLRTERAQLLGYESHADYMLANRMAKEPANVYNLLMTIWEPALKKAGEEAAMMQNMIRREGDNFNLESWDWWYYAEKIRKEKYDLDEEELRPYFSLEAVKDGLFTVVNKLYGLTFEERTDLPRYHEEVIAYEVKESDGSHLGILYMDFHPRPGKKGGAWSTSIRQEHVENGNRIAPVHLIVMNFTRPTGGKPALLSFDEALTFYHEFGHALHSMLTKCEYLTTSGTAVARDFVELPSQIM